MASLLFTNLILPTQEMARAEVRYSSRSHADPLINKARENGTLDGVTFGQKYDPCESLFKKFKSSFQLLRGVDREDAGHNVNVNFMRNSDGGLSVITDTRVSRPFDLETLEPHGVVNQSKLHKDLKGPMSAAHPAVDPATGEYFNFNLDFGPSDTYRVFRCNINTGKTDVLATFKDVKASYIHSMFLTKNYVILGVWPAIIFGPKVLWEKSIMEAIKFSPETDTTFVVIDRKSPQEGGRGVVGRFKAPPSFSFHTTNAWEESVDDKSVNIMLELFQYDNADILYNLYYNVLRGEVPQKDMVGAALVRHKLASIPLTGTLNATGKAEKVLTIAEPLAGDLQLINPNYRFRKHRYVYSTLNRHLSTLTDAIGKTDTENSTCVLWETAGHTPGEPVFLPRPGGTEEDDGIILSVVLDGFQRTSYLLCLDAKTMAEVGRAEVEHAVAFGFHGMYLNEAEAKQKKSKV